MTYILDTCVLSEVVRPAPDAGVLTFLGNVDGERLHLSVISIGEVRNGVAVLAAGRRRDRLERYLFDLEEQYADRILPVDLAVATRWGELTAGAARSGHPIGTSDGLIAATAAHHGLTLVTRNEADFAATGVTLLNPWNS